MPGVDLARVYADPGFQAMPEADQRAVLKELGYDSPQASGQKLLGGSEAKLSAGTEGESVWAAAREAVSQAIFGSPDRAEARAAGIGLQPTTAEMAETIGTGAAMAGGMGAAAGAAGKVGRVARAAMSPVGVGVGTAAYDMATGARPTDAALKGAGVAAAMKGAGGLAGGMSKMGGALGKLGELLKFARKAAPAQAPAVTGEAAAVGGATKALPKLDPQEIEAYVVEMRNQSGLSGAQITGFLRSKFGIPPKEGGQIVDMVLRANGLKQ